MLVPEHYLEVFCKAHGYIAVGLRFLLLANIIRIASENITSLDNVLDEV